MRWAAVALVLLAVTPAGAQEAGWTFSPLPGEGDRAAMGCAHNSDPTTFTCLVVRCEDDYTVGVHVHTSRAGSHAGRWRLNIDREPDAFTAIVDDAPYGARLEGDVALVIEKLKQGAMAYIDPLEGEPVALNGIPLTGSLYAINQALYFCAPRVVPEGEPAAAAD